MTLHILVVISILISLLSICLCVDVIYHVEEENIPGTYIGDIAFDTQLLESVQLEDYSLITFTQIQRRVTVTSKLFNVSTNGKLYTAQTLDAESLCTYNTECFRTVKVAVYQAKILMKIVRIKVIIEDINDHQPEFPMKQVNLQFYETDGKGTTKSIPNAIDKDVGVLNSQIIYQLEKNVDKPFSLSVSKRLDGTAKLKIILENKLDREIIDTYLIKVTAKDGGLQPKQNNLDVQISIADVNDNPPIFSQNFYNISIGKTSQKDKPIVILSATDQDSGKNGKVSYNFSPKTFDIAKTYLKLNQITGEITLRKNFSVYEKLTYKLFVEATDEGNPPLSSVAVLQVKVVNQQNNYPLIDVDFILQSMENKTTISEDIEMGTFIAYVIVIDDDIGQNGKITCELYNDKFKLIKLQENEYKIILKSTVDREIQDKYDITIICQDRGSPSLKTESKFSIQVTDVNDVQPQFIKKTFRFLTYENEKSNFPIGFINATDPDQGPGGQLTYSLLTNNKYTIPFQITDYGFISSMETLDHELQESYTFHVLVRDNGTPSLNNTANVIVKVLDRNDNAPYFTFPSVNPFTLDVHYYPQSKNDITILKASDRDSQGNAFLTYEILTGNDKQLFKVNSYTGLLSFSRTVYQNDAGAYDLQFVVKDSGAPVLSSTTTLSLTLTVSNKTSTMLTAVHAQAKIMIDVTLVIIIVAAAVIVSVVIVISITLCIIRSNSDRNSSATTGVNPSYQSRTEMKQLIYQTNTPCGTTKNSEEMIINNTELTGNQFKPEEGLEKEWQTSSIIRTLPKATKYSQPIRVTSYGEQDEQNIVLAPNYLSDTLSTERDRCVWSDRDTGHYEEIPSMAKIMK